MSNGKNRPTVALVLGIISIALGVLGICSGAFGLVSQAFKAEGAPKVPGDVQPWLNLVQGIGFALSVVLITSGIGLIRVKNWARLLSLIYAVVEIPVSLASSMLTAKVIKPILEQAAPRGLPPRSEPRQG